MIKDELKLGDWNAICDECGVKFKASKLRRRWDGMMVCPADYEQRHPQDFVRGKADKQKTAWNRSEATDTFAVAAPVDPSTL